MSNKALSEYRTAVRYLEPASNTNSLVPKAAEAPRQFRVVEAAGLHIHTRWAEQVVGAAAVQMSTAAGVDCFVYTPRVAGVKLGVQKTLLCASAKWGAQVVQGAPDTHQGAYHTRVQVSHLLCAEWGEAGELAW